MHRPLTIQAIPTVADGAHDMAELLKNAQGTLRGERDFTPEDIGQLRETMDAMAPIVAQSF
jgi:hypothetical protein